jgi:hypothetical protein
MSFKFSLLLEIISVGCVVSPRTDADTIDKHVVLNEIYKLMDQFAGTNLTSGSLGKFPSRNPRRPPFFGLRLGPRGRLAKQVQQPQPV